VSKQETGSAWRDGIDAFGVPEYLPPPKRPPGRPHGARDSAPRWPRRQNLKAEVSSHVLDSGWDSGLGSMARSAVR
jgi:hypothetical protein